LVAAIIRSECDDRSDRDGNTHIHGQEPRIAFVRGSAKIEAALKRSQTQFAGESRECCWIRQVISVRKPSLGTVFSAAARISLGVFFAISGGKKPFVASRTRQMFETLASSGIPFPHLMTYSPPRLTSSAAACSS
jgi:hypothetical protein